MAGDYDLDAINAEQLVTATDRALLGRARLRISHVQLARGSAAHLDAANPRSTRLWIPLGALVLAVLAYTIVIVALG